MATNAPTRKTHIVRIKHPSNPEIWVDIEVLDAISFRHINGKEMILSLDPTKVVPNIVDNTGDGNGKSNGPKATRRSHMKRIKSSSDPTQFLDIEVIDGVAFKDENGKEWILNHPDKDDLNKYNVTTGQGNPKSTRRVHLEKVYSDPNDKTSPYMLVERCDTMAFRTTNGEELIIVMPSSDDGSGKGRANSATTPQNYDPNSTKVVPPDNKDAEVYAFIPKGSSGVCTGSKGDDKTAITCGPLWWPRAINKKGGPWYWYIPTQTMHTYSIKFTPGKLEWLGNPTKSSWGGILPTWELVWLPGFLSQNLAGDQVYYHPFAPYGFGSLEDAILHGRLGLDWGLIDFSDTRIDSNASNGLSTNPCVPGVRGVPDIWQLTGTPAPDLVKPTPPDTKWLPGPISTKLAKQVAEAWLNDWNATSEMFNNQKAEDAGNFTSLFKYITWPFPVDDGGTQRFGNNNAPKLFTYPGTAFDVPLYDMTVNPPLTGGRYIGGLPPDFWGGAGTIGPETGVYAQFIGGGQLDPTKWNTSDPANPKLR
jgi:hypothetical protein